MTPSHRQTQAQEDSIDTALDLGRDPEAARWKRLARLAGASYLLMFGLALLANFVLLGQVLSPDPVTTAENVAQNPQLLRWSAVAFMLIAAIDVLLAWLLPILFQGVDRDLARLMGWFRLSYSVVLTLAVVFLVQASNRADDSGSIVTLLEAFHTTWALGLFLFGIHLMLLGWLMIRGQYATAVMGGLVLIAGVAYVADTLSQIISSGVVDGQGPLTPIVATLSVVSEGWLAIWLLLARRHPRQVGV